MSAGSREDHESSGPITRPDGPDEARAATAGLIVHFRWTLLAGSTASLATIFLTGSGDPAAIPVHLRYGIVAALGAAEAFALLAFATISRRTVRRGGLGAFVRGPIDEPGGRTLEQELAFAYTLYSFRCTLEIAFLLAAVLLAVMLLRVSPGTSTMTNLGMVLVLIGSQVPTRRRMERWSRRLTASRIDTLPPPGFLD